VTFSDNSAVWALSFIFRVGRTRGANECYGIWHETTASSVNIQLTHWLRSFVSDEG